ncbi:MAG: hypothetical protein V3U24_06380 [Candidatus Neomarinimicrobiota bacterium]
MEVMTIEDTINDIVLVVLNEKGLLTDVGISKNMFYSRILGYDEFGVWLEHPNFEIVVSEDQKGKPLPASKVRRERFDASIHVPWRNVATLIHFPKREGFDFPSPFERKIGFPTEEKKD